VEVLFSNAAISSLIRDRKTFQIPSVMQTSRKEGNQLMDDVLAGLIRDGQVLLEDVLPYATNRDVLDRAVPPDAMKKAA
jgi:twitching motility protein PilT